MLGSILKLLRDSRGAELFSKQAILVFSLVLVFSVGSLMINFFKDYFAESADNFNNSGKSNEFRSVNWL